MKRIVALLLALIMCLSLCGCRGGSKGTNENEGHLILTDEMLADIKAQTYDVYFSSNISILLTKYSGMSVSNYEVTNQRQTDDYSYTVFGIAEYTDDYGKNHSEKINVVFCAVPDGNAGYSIDFYWASPK